MDAKVVRLKEVTHFIVFDHPFHDQLKSELVPMVENSVDVMNKETNVKSSIHTEWNWKPENDKIKRLKKCVSTQIETGYGLGNFNDDGSVKLIELEFQDFWANLYRKGDYATPHHHVPALFSFVYFLKTKWYHPPLTFTSSGKKVRPKEGRYVIFPSFLLHHVPKSRFDDTRITLSGNLYFKKKS